MIAILPQMNIHTCSINVTFGNMVDIFEEIDDGFGDSNVQQMRGLFPYSATWSERQRVLAG